MCIQYSLSQVFPLFQLKALPMALLCLQRWLNGRISFLLLGNNQTSALSVLNQLCRSTTSDDFITTTYVEHIDEGAMNPLIVKVKREDLSVLCIPSLPVAPDTIGVEFVYPSSSSDGVRWPGFLFQWSDAYCGYIDSKYVLDILVPFFFFLLYDNFHKISISYLPRSQTSLYVEFPVTLSTTNVSWNIYVQTPVKNSTKKCSSFTFTFGTGTMPYNYLTFY